MPKTYATPADLESEVLTGFLAVMHALDLDDLEEVPLASRLCWDARRAGEQVAFADAAWSARRADLAAQGDAPPCPAEVIDRMLIAGPGHLRVILDDYVAYYNRHRPHRARNLLPPDCADVAVAPVTDLAAAQVRRRGVPGGLIHEYERSA